MHWISDWLPFLSLAKTVFLKLIIYILVYLWKTETILDFTGQYNMYIMMINYHYHWESCCAPLNQAELGLLQQFSSALCTCRYFLPSLQFFSIFGCCLLFGGRITQSSWFRWWFTRITISYWSIFLYWRYCGNTATAWTIRRLRIRWLVALVIATRHMSGCMTQWRIFAIIIRRIGRLRSSGLWCGPIEWRCIRSVSIFRFTCFRLLWWRFTCIRSWLFWNYTNKKINSCRCPWYVCHHWENYTFRWFWSRSILLGVAAISY